MHGASAIEDDIANLAAGRPDIVNLQRLTAFSEQNVIALPGQPDEGNISSQRLIWVDDRLFDRLLHSVLAFLEPSQVRTTALGQLLTAAARLP
jgi:hypothetical protein